MSGRTVSSHPTRGWTSKTSPHSRANQQSPRQARLAVRPRHPEPLHWAGWVCAGEFA